MEIDVRLGRHHTQYQNIIILHLFSFLYKPIHSDNLYKPIYRYKISNHVKSLQVNTISTSLQIEKIPTSLK